MPKPSKEAGLGYVEAIDRAHAIAEIADIEEAIAANRAITKVAVKEKSMTALTTLARQLRELTADLNRRRAELRMIDGSGEVIDPDSVTREMVAAVESGDWPLPLVEVLYLACRRVLRIEEHLPEAPVTQWH
jgi:hypothetical protein